MPSETLEIRNVPAKQLSQLKRAATRQGISFEKYVKRVLLDHLDRMRRIEESSFFELAGPLRKALAGKTEEQLDALVEAARARRRENRRRRRSA
jgi:hypothetical protein